MKQILFMYVISLCITMQTNAQLRDSALNTNTYIVDADQLFQKAKNEKTTVWVLLGGGGVVTLDLK